MKRFFSILTLCIMLLSMCGFTSCQLFCDHDYIIISDTATCEKAGIKTYECSKCKKQYTEDSVATGHKWSGTSDTATCEADGIKTYTCKNCNKTRTETSKAFGHNYSDGMTCSRCKNTKYKITIKKKTNYTTNRKRYKVKFVDWADYCVWTDYFIDSSNKVQLQIHTLYDLGGETYEIYEISYTLKTKKGKTLKKGDAWLYIKDLYTSGYVNNDGTLDYLLFIDYPLEKLDEKEEYVLSLTIWL